MPMPSTALHKFYIIMRSEKRPRVLNYVALAVLIILVITFLWPLVGNIHKIHMEEDWLEHAAWELSTVKSIKEFHAFPLWCPFFGGGYPIISYPEGSAVTPWVFLFLTFGTWEGLRVLVFIYMLIGALGMFYLANKVLGFSKFGSFFSSAIFVFGGYSINIIEGGLFTSMHFFYLPLLLALFIKSKENKKLFVLAVFLASLILLRGSLKGAVIYLFILLFSIIDSLGSSIKTGRINISTLKRCCFLFIFSILMSMLKILPVWELFNVNNRAADYQNVFNNALAFNQIRQMLFIPSAEKNILSPNYYYIGFIPVILAAFSVVFNRKNPVIKLFFILIIFLVLSLGPNSPLDLNKVIWGAPIFHSMGDPKAYYFPVVLFLICLISAGFFNVIRKKYSLLLKVPIYAICLVFIFHIYFLHRNWFKGISFKEPSNLVQADNFYQVNLAKGKEPWPEYQQYINTFRGVGTINWETDLRLPENAAAKTTLLPDASGILNNDYRGESYFLKEINSVEEVKFGINEFTVRVNIKQPDILLLNQSYYRGWRCDHGLVSNFNGLISVGLKKTGIYNVKFRYAPVSFYAGLAISALTFIFLIRYALG